MSTEFNPEADVKAEVIGRQIAELEEQLAALRRRLPEEKNP